MVTKILDFIFSRMTATSVTTTDSIDEPSPLRPLLESNPLPVIEDDTEVVQKVIRKMKAATRRKIICLETAVAILDDDDLHRALKQLPGSNT